ncbi:hypothetical protein GOP47_0028219 [Adiantum capillus-veneris]|nr:hypothetical protein GOP47_0028219 [Adiantum capillus-veneris]
MVPCLGRGDRNCLCAGCMDVKLLLLRQASPSLQRSVLQYLPAFGLTDQTLAPPRSPPPRPASPPRQQASPSWTNPNLHQAASSSSSPMPHAHSSPILNVERASSPTRSNAARASSPTRPNAARASSPTRSHPPPSAQPTVAMPCLATSPSASVFQNSLFSIPLFTDNLDVQFDSLPQQDQNRSYKAEDIVIPPLLRQRIPNIENCINYAMSSCKITGPRKEAAMVEAIEEVLAISRGGHSNITKD